MRHEFLETIFKSKMHSCSKAKGTGWRREAVLVPRTVARSS